MPRSVLLIAGLAACASIAFAIACGDDYSEANAPPGGTDAGSEGPSASDAGGETDADGDGAIEERDANAFVHCPPSDCSPTCCLMKDASAPPMCCGGNTAGWDIILKCAREANCPTGQICCIHKGTSQTTAECIAPSECTNPAARMCDGNALKQGCKIGQTCSESYAQSTFGLPTGYAVCFDSN